MENNTCYFYLYYSANNCPLLLIKKKLDIVLPNLFVRKIIELYPSKQFQCSYTETYFEKVIIMRHIRTTKSIRPQNSLKHF